MSSIRFRHALVVSSLAGATVVGCLLVAPIGDRPAPTGAGGATSTGGAGGDSATTTTVGTGGAGGAAPDGGECTHNAECIAVGADEPHRCRDGRCIPLRTQECPLVYGNAGDDNAIFFGAFSTLDPSHPDDSPLLYTYRLAQEELSGNGRGGLPGFGTMKARPLVMIACNADSSAIDAAMKHLAGDDPDAVGVPAILAYMKPGDLNRAYMNNRPGQIFYMNPVGSDRALTGTPHNGLMWHMLGQPSDLVPAYAEVLRLAEQYVRDNRGVGSRPIRVALVSTTEAFDSELADFVVPALRFNGQDTTGNGAANYLGITIDLGSPQLTDDLNAKAFSICDFQPDIVVSTAGDAFTRDGGVLQTIEVAWEVCTEKDAAVPPRPFYVLSPVNIGNQNNVIKVISGQMLAAHPIDAQAYRRFVGISAARAADTTLYNQFGERLRRRFPPPANIYIETENFYDAFYYLAYAMYGAGSVAKLTGPGIADGMLRLIDGTNVFDVGSLAINDVLAALSVPNSTIRLNGTLGPAKFVRQTGARVDVGSVYCFSAMGTNVAVHSQVLRYDPTPDDQSPGRFTGNFDCFPGFVR